MSEMTLKTEGDKHVVVTRRFAASPEAVYRAHTEPRLIQKWLLGPDGWTMPVCVSEARPGGKIRYEWTDGKGGGFHLTGEYLELVPFSRIVHVERMHLPDPTPDNHVETRFEQDATGTLMTMRITLPDAETRAAMLATGMEHGMEASYARLEAMISAGNQGTESLGDSNMLATPSITTTNVEEAAVIRLTVPRSEMRKAFGPAVGELIAALAAQGIEPVGAVFAHHLKMSPDTFDFELGVRVSAPVKAAGRVKPGQLPAVKVARTVYSGPYEGLPSAWGEFNKWMKANGHEQAENLWEVYSVGPQSSPDPANWRTELNRPLAN